MVRVCIVGEDDNNVRYELFSRETAREALQTYDDDQPFANSVAVETASLGTAVSLLNDLNWYLVRFAKLSMVLVPDVVDDEWLSRDLATAIRNEELPPEESDRYLTIYGLEDGRLVEPMYVTRQPGGTVPEYDLRETDQTVIVRVSKTEFEG
jgi:hypothetical protein